MRKLLRGPSPALIVACVALLAALAGTSLASSDRAALTTPAVVSKGGNIAGHSTGSLLVTCPKGKSATGGGGYLAGVVSNDDHLLDSEPARVGTPAQNGFVPQPLGRPIGWHVTIFNPGSETRLGTVYVICV